MLELQESRVTSCGIVGGISITANRFNTKQTLRSNNLVKAKVLEKQTLQANSGTW
jgi:hypothetical protein